MTIPKRNLIRATHSTTLKNSPFPIWLICLLPCIISLCFNFYVYLIFNMFITCDDVVFRFCYNLYVILSIFKNFTVFWCFLYCTALWSLIFGIALYKCCVIIIIIIILGITMKLSITSWYNPDPKLTLKSILCQKQGYIKAHLVNSYRGHSQLFFFFFSKFELFWI